ncbi:hypothetical protein [Kitasatospora sp. NRRL B-11411]|uniref:hypothetical protein n=1 Tax=Kitasatospora sp. NRRL B-11411 TaxID=1463822 RepID=UPI0012FF0DB5|nr:hypothetical protein [Kitasatospora sp. NRRL B-11411]
MGRTVHEDMAEGYLEDFLEHPEAMAALTRLRNRHIRGEMVEEEPYGSGYADSLGSSARFPPNRWPLHQHAAFIQLHALIGSGEVAFTKIRTGGTPGPDADREGNAALLAGTHKRFTAELDMGQNGADFDGILSWEGDLKISKPTGAFYYGDSCASTGQTLLVLPAAVPGGWAPLEVGDSWPSRTLMHLWQYKAVARWPYGARFIWLFLNLDWR